MPDEQTPMDRLHALIDDLADDPRGRWASVKLSPAGARVDLHDWPADGVPDHATRHAAAGPRWWRWEDGPIVYVASPVRDPHLTDAQWLDGQ